MSVMRNVLKKGYPLTRFRSSAKGTKSVRFTPDLKLDNPSLSASSASCSEKDLTEGTGTHPRITLISADLKIVGGHSVQACALLEGLESEGYRIRFLPINPAFPRGLRWLRRIPYLRTLLNQVLYLPSLMLLRHTEVVHIFSASYWSFLLAPAPAMLMGRLLRKRVVLHYHSGEADDHLARWGMLVHPWLRLAHVIVVPSTYLQCIFARHGYRARVIQNVVDTSCFRYRERVPLNPRLLSTRNFEPHYRIDITLKAFGLIRIRYPEAILTLAGTGSEEANLRRLAAMLPKNSVRFVGRVDPKYMPDLCDESDIFVNASVIDNQPVSILEAFAAGLPVVSTSTGGIASMVRDNETGLLIRSGSPTAMAEAVMTLLENPRHAVQMAHHARKEVERYAWSQVRNMWAAVYSGSSLAEIPK